MDRFIAVTGEELDVKIPMEEYLRIRKSGEYRKERKLDHIERANTSH